MDRFDKWMKRVEMILVVIEARGLLAGVALRAGVRLVALDLDEMAVRDLDLQPAVDAAKNAAGALPVSGARGLGCGARHAGLPVCGS